MQAIVAEGDQLNRGHAIRMRYTTNSLRLAKREELLLLANRYGFDGSTYTDKAIIVELCTRQAQIIDIERTARETRVAQAHERIAHMSDRLRELLPHGMTLGDYFQLKSYAIRKRPAFRTGLPGVA